MERVKKEKRLFFAAVAASYLLILIYNCLTPMMTDDLSYKAAVLGASSFLDLIRQEYVQYTTWTGRSVVHMILRLFLLQDKAVFNVLNSAAFVWLLLCMYGNVEHRKRYDTGLFLLLNLLVWLFGVVFRQTVLWETGACNYLWGSMIILSFVTLYRFGLKREASCWKAATGSLMEGSRTDHGAIGPRGIRHPLLWAAGMFILGVLAGWCNENTSGGGILMVLLCLIAYLAEAGGGTSGKDDCPDGAAAVPADQAGRGKGKRQLLALLHSGALRLWMITGLLGQCVGFLFMILAPGNSIRASYKEEEHSGLFAYVSRFQKIVLAIEENFLPLLLILLLLVLLVRYQRKDWKEVFSESRTGFFAFIVFLATCFALVLTPEPQTRAYFGAGIFLMIAVAQFWTNLKGEQGLYPVIRQGLLWGMLLVMAFTYLDCGANVARIYREYRERDAYLAEQAEAGVTDVTVPMLRPDFDNLYSDGYNSDIEEDPSYWVNVIYATYYGFDSVSGVEREDWTEY